MEQDQSLSALQIARVSVAAIVIDPMGFEDVVGESIVNAFVDFEVSSGSPVVSSGNGGPMQTPLALLCALRSGSFSWLRHVNRAEISYWDVATGDLSGLSTAVEECVARIRNAGQVDDALVRVERLRGRRRDGVLSQLEMVYGNQRMV